MPPSIPHITFKDLAIGEHFIFASEKSHPFSGMARGPWTKLSARVYCPKGRPSERIRIGSTKSWVLLP